MSCMQILLIFLKNSIGNILRNGNAVENHWDELFSEVEVNINVKAHIRREGYITKPGALPERRGERKVRWGAFFGTTLIIIIIIFIQWPRIKQYSKKDKWAFFILIFIGWGSIHVRSPEYGRPYNMD